MNVNEFHKQLAVAPLSFRRRLRNYLRHPTGGNACHIAGYVAALEDARLFKTDDAARYWLALIGCVEDNVALGRELIAETDNPPAGGAQAEDYVLNKSDLTTNPRHFTEIGALLRVEERVQRDEALLRQALDRLEAVVERFDPYISDNECRPMENARSTIAALRERLGEGAEP